MIFSKRLLWFGLRSCLYCGSLDRHADGLCEVCSADLWSWQEDGELFSQDIEGMKVHSLFHWIPGEQEVLSRLVRALKGPGGEELWKFYAEEFWRRQLPSYLDSRIPPLILVPSPALVVKNKGGGRDHAWLFAEGLAEASGGGLYPWLQRNSQTTQRRKNREARRRTALKWNEAFTWAEFQQKTVGKQIVFVDDIVTTGSTALAAWRCLGKPRDFAVWALAQRGLSCGASRSLI